MANKKTKKKDTKNHTPPMMVRLSERDIERIDEIIRDRGVANRSDVIRLGIRVLGFMEWEREIINPIMDKFGRVIEVD
jgi:Arc/MetJ-type ribon-helix-helix transcriptional regulator